MASKIRVFICYRKKLSYQENGQTIREKNVAVETFNHILNQSGAYDSWVDTDAIAAGMEWEATIYEQLLKSDVLVVLIRPSTSESQWVQREIALATALGISIVPIGFDLSDEQMMCEAKELSIDNLQWTITKNVHWNRADALLAEIKIPLEKASAATPERQRTTLKELWNRQNPSKPKSKLKAHDNQKAASYRLFKDNPQVLLHVASGDMMKIRNVDVFVNSENDYMQMARFFEKRTISSMLRRRGARVLDGRYQDTIQQELDWNLRNYSRPVQASAAFATSAGGPSSELAKFNKARAIIHVSAVQAVDAICGVTPYKEPHQIEESVRATLTKLSELNNTNGVFSPPNTDQRSDQEKRADGGYGGLCSIVFPLLGTGQGGAEVSEVIGPIVDSLIEYLSDDDNIDLRDTLSEVYISAFSEDDVSVVKATLNGRCESITSNQ